MEKKAIYLIQESGCLNPYSGAFHHISMGLKELSKYFIIKLYLNSSSVELADYVKKINPDENKKEIIKKVRQRGYVYGTLKDIHIFISNLKSVPKLIKLFKSENVDFIYERASYLNYSGLIACLYLGIPHFYESNGLQFESRINYYKSFFNSLAKRLEKMFYSLSSHTFFVGTYGDYWNMNKNNWSNVENGIESNLVLKINNKTKEVYDVCFVGRYMSHQRLDILVDSLINFENKNLVRVNLIGTGFEEIENKLININVNVMNHGFVKRTQLVDLINGFDIAVIPGFPEYQSCMKLFDYGAAGCAVLAPNTYNLNYWFSNELLFFDGSANDLQSKLSQLIGNDKLINELSSRLNNKISSEFTWSSIFNYKSTVIDRILNRND